MATKKDIIKHLKRVIKTVQEIDAVDNICLFVHINNREIFETDVFVGNITISKVV